MQARLLPLAANARPRAAASPEGSSQSDSCTAFGTFSWSPAEGENLGIFLEAARSVRRSTFTTSTLHNLLCPVKFSNPFRATSRAQQL